MLTKKQIFERVKNHLLKQNSRSGSRGFCEYLGIDNKKCAVGCLIEDNEYNSKMEGLSVRSILSIYRFKNFDSRHLSILIDLQLIHDSDRVEDWPKKLKDISCF